jgi:hypothetical protein
LLFILEDLGATDPNCFRPYEGLDPSPFCRAQQAVVTVGGAPDTMRNAVRLPDWPAGQLLPFHLKTT